MCFQITSETEEITGYLRNHSRPITAYKMLNKDFESPFYSLEGPEWAIGKEIRLPGRTTRLTYTEKRFREVDNGLHLYRNPPQMYPYPSLCPRPCPYPRLCPYLCSHNHRRWAEVEVQPSDIVAASHEELVVTACRVVREI